MREEGTCRNEGCGRSGPLREDGCCSQACSEAIAIREHIQQVRIREAWTRQQLTGLGPVAASQRRQKLLHAEEAAELAAGCRHLTIIHGYLERAEDWQLLERLLEAIEAACAGHRWQRTGHHDRLTLTVGPPGAEQVVAGLAEVAHELAEEAVAGGGYRWQVALLKYPRERGR
jgi:hypothetical protein